MIIKIVSRLLFSYMFFSLAACNLQQDTTSSALTSRETATKIQIELGLSYLQQGNISRAKMKLLLALQQMPKSPLALEAMAYFWEKTGEIAKARLYYQRAIKFAPDEGVILNNYGVFLCQQGEYFDAEKFFLKAVKDVNYLYPAEAYENMGICALAIPDVNKAQFYFMKSINQDARRKTALLGLANLACQKKDFIKTQYYLQKYIQLYGHDIEVLNLEKKIHYGFNQHTS